MAVIESGGLRLGTAADAGAVCVTEQSPTGLSAEMFRFYVRTQGAPAPHQVRDPISRDMVAARDAHGRELFDLDEVAAWNAARPGTGARKGRPMRWTQLRHDLLAGARDGTLTRSQSGRACLGGLELRSRALQRIGEFLDAGLLREPRSLRGRYRLTPAGERWLAQHDPPAPPDTPT